MPPTVLPDADAAVIAYLDAHASLTPLHGGRVGKRLAAGDAAAVRITALGGVQEVPWEGTAEYQAECWGARDGDGSDAALLARTIIGAIFDLRGPITGGHIVGSNVVGRPVDSPDPETARPRSIIQFSVTIYPEAS